MAEGEPSDFLSRFRASVKVDCPGTYKDIMDSDRSLFRKYMIPRMLLCGIPKELFTEHSSSTSKFKGYILGYRLLWLSAIFWCMAFYVLGFTTRAILGTFAGIGDVNLFPQDAWPNIFNVFNFSSRSTGYPEHALLYWLIILLIFLGAGLLTGMLSTRAKVFHWSVFFFFGIAGYEAACADGYQFKWWFTLITYAFAVLFTYFMAAWFPLHTQERLAETTI
jgi:hypothetical protein